MSDLRCDAVKLGDRKLCEHKATHLRDGGGWPRFVCGVHARAESPYYRAFAFRFRSEIPDDFFDAYVAILRKRATGYVETINNARARLKELRAEIDELTNA